MTTRPTPVVPGDLFARYQTIKGLRELADFLEANPGLPVDEYGCDYNVFADRSADEAGQRTEIQRIGTVLGETPDDDTAHGGHLTVSKTFGRITYKAIHIPDKRMAQYDALMSYSGNVKADEDQAAGEAA